MLVRFCSGFALFVSVGTLDYEERDGHSRIISQ